MTVLVERDDLHNVAARAFMRNDWCGNGTVSEGEDERQEDSDVHRGYGESLSSALKIICRFNHIALW